MSAKKVLVGLGIAGAVGLAVALASGDASASGRKPWTEPFELPNAGEIVEIKTTICTLHRGGLTGKPLMIRTLETVYAGPDWETILGGGGLVEGDDPSVGQVMALIVSLVGQFLALPPVQAESWCNDPEVPPVEPPPPPKPTGGGGTTIPSDVIGGGWEDWPERDSWKSEADIGASLNAIGYPVAAGFLEPSYKITTAKNRDAIKKFQSDYNGFRGKSGCIVLVPGNLVSRYNLTPKKLTVDGWIGPNTWKAMRLAFRMNAQTSWLKTIADCKKV